MQISTDDFWETSTQRIDPFEGDLGDFGNYDDVIDIFGGNEEPFLDEDGNVIPTTIPPQDCGESGNCFDGFGDVSEEYDDDVSQGTIQRDSIQGWARVVRIFQTSSGRSSNQQQK